MAIITKTKTNGYTAESLQKMISLFDRAAELLFPGCTVKHFYYGDHCDMVDLLVGGTNHYAHFNIYSDRVSLNGYTCSDEEMARFESMTHNDECFAGRLLKITETKERHFNLRHISECNFRATNIPHIVLKAWQIGSAYTGEIVTKKGNMVLMLGVHYTLENLLKAADEFISEYKGFIDEIIVKEEK